jgi:hypothetical protein
MEPRKGCAKISFADRILRPGSNVYGSETEELPMKRILVRYKTDPERIAENSRLIEGVQEELRARAPQGLRYLVLRLEDGTFIHFAAQEDGATPLPEYEAFRRFQTGIRERCIEAPQAAAATVVLDYRMLAAADRP